MALCKQLGKWAPSLAALSLACGGELIPVASQGVEVPDAELEGVLFEGHRAGLRDIEVRARIARIDPEERRAELEGVRIELADSDRGRLSIRAERGTLDLVADDFLLSGRVEGVVGDEQRFRTSEVRYESERQRLWTDQPVNVSRGPIALEGRGMELDLASRTLRIRGRVRTTLEGSE